MNEPVQEPQTPLAIRYEAERDLVVIEFLDRLGQPYASRRVGAAFFRNLPEDPTEQMFGLAKHRDSPDVLEIVPLAIDIEVGHAAVVAAHQEVKRRFDQSAAARAGRVPHQSGPPRILVAGPGDLPKA